MTNEIGSTKKKRKSKPHKKKKFTDEELIQARKLAALGLRVEHIGNFFGVAKATMENYMKRLPELEEAIHRGRAEGVGKIAQSLGQAALNGNVTAQIFYLKTIGRWSEHNPLDHEQTNILFKTEILPTGEMQRLRIESAKDKGDVIDAEATTDDDD